MNTSHAQYSTPSHRPLCPPPLPALLFAFRQWFFPSLRSLILSAAVFSAAYASPSQAQPANLPSTRPTIIELGSQVYDVEALPIIRENSSHNHRIHILRPRRPAPPAGYPVLYLLDGNAVLLDFDEAFLERIAGNAPVIVTLGYETDRRFHPEARAYDYTPPVNGNEDEPDPLAPQRRTGGADRFLDFLERSVRPAVAQRLPIDPQHQGIWGHSYGGLFVLYALLTQPQRFQCYIAASPSLWWRDGYLLTLEESGVKKLAEHPVSLMITRGSAEARRNTQTADRQIRASAPPDTAKQFTERLAQAAGIPVEYREFPGLSHGAAFAASLEPALQWFGNCTANRDSVAPATQRPQE